MGVAGKAGARVELATGVRVALGAIVKVGRVWVLAEGLHTRLRPGPAMLLPRRDLFTVNRPGSELSSL